MPAAMWGAATAGLLVVQYVASGWDRPRPSGSGIDAVASALSGWVQFDGFHYLKIATDGYSLPPGQEPIVAWFPGYPLAIRAVNTVVPNAVVAAVLVSAAAGLAATLLFWSWCQRMGMRRNEQVTATAVLIVLPTAWFLTGVVYSDALFLALAIGAFVLLERRHPLWAGVVGAAATAVRPTGIALVAGLVVLALERDGVLHSARGRFLVPSRFRWRSVRPVHLCVLMSLGGLLAYMTYGWIRFDDPLAFYHAQSWWRQGPAGGGWSSVLKLDLIVPMLKFRRPTYLLKTIPQAIMVLAYGLATPFVGRRFGWGYATYVLGMVGIVVISSRDFLGAGRYLLAAFPVPALLGAWLADRGATRTVYLTASACVLVLLSVLFARGAYLT
jgi:hypothetical protein